MTRWLRSSARRLLGVGRRPTYYLPWIVRPGLECALVLSNVEARFKPEYSSGPFRASVVQYDAQGVAAHRYDVALQNSTDAVELPLKAAAGSCGFVTVSGDRILSDLYVTLSDGHDYTATHGRGEFIETYPRPTRALLTAACGMASLAGRTIPLFARNQYVYLGPDSRSHVLLMNLSNVTNAIRVVLSAEGRAVGFRLLRLPPMGTHLLDIASLAPGQAPHATSWRIRLEGNAWFNLYLVGAGPLDVAGPLSLMHVK
jgi:hypothetical protein